MMTRQDDHHIGFEELDHTADRALRVCGHTWEELLLNAARGMNSLMVGGQPTRATQIKKNVNIHALDAESLLVEWLSELAFWAETKMIVFDQIEFQKATSHRIQAVLYGATVRNLEKHIKAVTYHNLKIIETKKGLEATVVFDV